MQFSHPRETTILCGHEDILKRVIQSFDMGKLPHALLLSGPKGIGKATFAYYLARYLLSQTAEQSLAFDLGDQVNRPSLLMFDESVVSQVAARAHVDLFVVEKGLHPRTGKERQEITVDEARKLRQFFSLTAVSSLWRVAIIDSVDEMNRSGANAILKVLEEPPKQTLLILISHIHELPFNTITSRCQRHVFQPLILKDFISALASEGETLSLSELELIFHLSDGSPGIATGVIHNDGVTLFHELENLLGQAPRIDYSKVHNLSDELCARGAEEKFDLAMKYIAKWLSTAIRAKFNPKVGIPIVSQDMSTASRLISRKKLDEWVHLWEETNRLYKQVKKINLDRKHVFLSTFLSISKLSES